MVEIHAAGTLPHLPESPGVLLLTCGYMGRSGHALGDVLLISVAPNLRKRLGTLHAGSSTLRDFGEAGGQIDVLYATLEGRAPAGLEAALVQEHVHRAGARPAWNRAVPKGRPPAQALAEAERILDALNVKPR